jgi:hypothetical protein
MLSPDARRSAHVWIITVRVEQVLRGASTPGTTEVFQMFQAGTYWPDWASPGPDDVSTGRQYCIFLREVDGRLYSNGGVNGFFQVADDGSLVKNGQLRVPVNVERIQKMVQETQPNE